MALLASACSTHRFSVEPVGALHRAPLPAAAADDYVKVEAYVDESGFDRGPTAAALGKSDLSLTATLIQGSQQVEIPLYFRSSSAAYSTSSTVVLPWTRSQLADELSIEIRAITAGKGYAPGVSSAVSSLVGAVNATPVLGSLAQLSPLSHANKITQLIAAETKDTLIDRYELRLEDAVRLPHESSLLAYAVVGHKQGSRPDGPSAGSLSWGEGPEPRAQVTGDRQVPLLVLVISRAPLLRHPGLPSDGLSCEALDAARLADLTSQLNTLDDWLTHAQRDAEHQLLAIYRGAVGGAGGAGRDALVGRFLETVKERPAAESAFPELTHRARLCALRRAESAASAESRNIRPALEALYVLQALDATDGASGTSGDGIAGQTDDALRALNRYRAWLDGQPVAGQLATFNERVRQTAESLERPYVERVRERLRAAAEDSTVGAPSDESRAVPDPAVDPYLCLACPLLVREAAAVRDEARQRARIAADSARVFEALRGVPETHLVKRAARSLLGDARRTTDAERLSELRGQVEGIAAVPAYERVAFVRDGEEVEALAIRVGERVDVSVAGLHSDSVNAYEHFTVWENRAAAVVAMVPLSSVGEDAGAAQGSPQILGPSSVHLVGLAPGTATVRVGVGPLDRVLTVVVSEAEEGGVEDGTGIPQDFSF